MPTKMTNKGGHPSGVKEPGDFTYVWENGVRSELVFCAQGCKFGKCCIKISESPAQHPVFHWDGIVDSPTITPSIGCDHRCGLHLNITGGVILP